MHADTATWTVNSNETWVHKRLKAGWNLHKYQRYVKWSDLHVTLQVTQS